MSSMIVYAKFMAVLSGAIFLSLVARPAQAQVHGGDVELRVLDGKIVTGRTVDVMSTPTFTPTFVFEAELGEIIENEVDEPGFDCEPGTFPSSSSVQFHILDSLRKWDGDDFDLIPSEDMGMAFSSLGPVETPAAPSVVDGFALNVAGDGSWHRHYDFLFGAPHSTGIYLLQLGLSSSEPSIAPSDPFFIVFNQNDSKEHHEAAIDWVNANLIVPEPSSWALAVLALGAAWVYRPRRRRRS